MSLAKTLFGDWFSKPSSNAISPKGASPGYASGSPVRPQEPAKSISATSATRSVSDITDAPESNRQYYKSLSGDVYCFWLSQYGNGYRIYILEHPSYGSRSSSLHDTHRFYDSDKKVHYICYSPLPKNKFDAMMIAGKWADNTSIYIRTGKAF